MNKHRLLIFELVFVLAIAAFVLGMVWLASINTDEGFGYYARDANAIQDEQWYAGFLSNLGIILTIGAAGAALVASWHIKENRSSGPPWLLIAIGIFTVVLALDDLYLLHETVFPRYIRLQESVTLAFYGLAGIVLVFLTWKTIRSRAVVFAIAAGIFTLLSQAIDLDIVSEAPFGEDYRSALEDGFKFVAILFWLWFVQTLTRSELARLRDLHAPRR